MLFVVAVMNEGHLILLMSAVCKIIFYGILHKQELSLVYYIFQKTSWENEVSEKHVHSMLGRVPQAWFDTREKLKTDPLFDAESNIESSHKLISSLKFFLRSLVR